MLTFLAATSPTASPTPKCSSPRPANSGPHPRRRSSWKTPPLESRQPRPAPWPPSVSRGPTTPISCPPPEPTSSSPASTKSTYPHYRTGGWPRNRLGFDHGWQACAIACSPAVSTARLTKRWRQLTLLSTRELKRGADDGGHTVPGLLRPCRSDAPQH